MRNHHPCYIAGESKIVSFCYTDHNKPGTLCCLLSYSPSVSAVDDPQAAAVFPLSWLIFQDPPPLDVASTSSHSSH